MTDREKFLLFCPGAFCERRAGEYHVYFYDYDVAHRFIRITSACMAWMAWGGAWSCVKREVLNRFAINRGNWMELPTGLLLPINGQTWTWEELSRDPAYSVRLTGERSYSVLDYLLH